MCRATYELTALVAHIQDDGADLSQDSAPQEGHLVAHIKVSQATPYEPEGAAAIVPAALLEITCPVHQAVVDFG